MTPHDGGEQTRCPERWRQTCLAGGPARLARGNTRQGWPRQGAKQGTGTQTWMKKPPEAHETCNKPDRSLLSFAGWSGCDEGPLGKLSKPIRTQEHKTSKQCPNHGLSVSIARNPAKDRPTTARHLMDAHDHMSRCDFAIYFKMFQKISDRDRSDQVPAATFCARHDSAAGVRSVKACARGAFSVARGP